MVYLLGILRHCAEYLSGPLQAIFNKSIELDCFPSAWKKSFIIPLLKTGNKLEVYNYRSIAKLNAVPKLFEKIVTDTLYHQISSILTLTWLSKIMFNLY